MNCTTFETWLEESVGERDRTLPSSAAAHLSGCPACRARWAAEVQLDRAVALWQRAPQPASEAAKSVVVAVLADRNSVVLPAPRSSASAPRRGVLWSAVACGIAALAVTAWHRPTPDRTAPALTDVPADTLPVSDSVVALWTDVGRTSQSVAEETLHSLEEFTALSARSLPTVPVTEPASVPAAPAWRSLSEPIGERVNTAFGFLGDVLPNPAAG
jgi:hypothetical protein